MGKQWKVELNITEIQENRASFSNNTYYSWIDNDPQINKVYQWGLKPTVITAFIKTIGKDRIKTLINEVENDPTARCKSRVLLYRLRKMENQLKTASIA